MSTRSKQKLSLAGIQQLVSQQPPLPPSSLVDAFADLEAMAYNQSVDDKTGPTLSAYYTCYFLALVLEDNLYEARFLSHRCDKNLMNNDGQVISAYTVLRALWNRDYEAFHGAIQNAPWGEAAAVMAVRVVDHVRRRTLNLLSHAYTTIPPASAATYLGLTSAEEATRTLVEQHGWTYDQTLELLSPGKREELLPKNTELTREEQLANGGDTPVLGTVSGNAGMGDAVGKIAALSGFVEKLTDG